VASARPAGAAAHGGPATTQLLGKALQREARKATPRSSWPSSSTAPARHEAAHRGPGSRLFRASARAARTFKSVKLDAVVDRARASTCAGALEDSGREITHDALPEVEGDESQLVQLMQNLAGQRAQVSAARAAPRVHVSVVEKGRGIRDRRAGQRHRHRCAVLSSASFMVFPAPARTRASTPAPASAWRSCKKVVRPPPRPHLGWKSAAPARAAASSSPCPGKKGGQS